MARVSILKVVSFVAVFTLMVALLPGVSLAAGPEWSSGFPKLAQKNALLQWSPVKGATEYKVYRGEQKGQVKLIATVKVNRYIDKDLPAGKTFHYEVSAVIAGKEGAHSAEGLIKTAAEKVFVPLKAPTLQGGHVKDLPDGKASVGIRWEGAAGTDLVGVNVYRSKVKGKDFALVGSSSSDTFEDKDVQRGDTYYYVVTSVDSQFNETKHSNEISVNVPAPVAAAEAPKQGAKAETTTMKPVKLLFRIPSDKDARRSGAEEYTLGSPLDVAVDEAVGHVYVTSAVYGGVLVYDMEGKLQFGIRKDGVGGSEKFKAVKCVAVGKNGNVYVTDINSSTVSVFNFSGKPVMSFDVNIHGGQANNCGIAVDDAGTIYVTEAISNSVQVFDSSGKRLYEIVGIRDQEEAKKSKTRQHFNGPAYITLLNDGGFVFVDGAWSKLVEYNKEGKFRKYISKRGTNAGDLDYPMGITTGTKGEIFVSSGMSPNIQAFSPDGKFLYALCNEKCDGPIDSNALRGIYIDSKDRLYVTEDFNNRVSVYQLGDRTVEVAPK